MYRSDAIFSRHGETTEPAKGDTEYRRLSRGTAVEPMMDEENSFMNAEMEMAETTAAASRATSAKTPRWGGESGYGQWQSSERSSPLELELAEIIDAAGGPSGSGANKKRKANFRMRKAIKKTDSKFPTARFEREMHALAVAVKDVVQYANAAKGRTEQFAQEEAAEKPVMVVSSTDTELTPHWWSASDEDPKDAPLAELDRPRTRTETRA